MNIKVKKLNPKAILPTRKHADDLGFDLYLLEDVVVPPHDCVKAKTGIAVELPEGWGAKIFERSGTASEAAVTIGAGVIDPGYRGELVLVVFNHYPEFVRFEAGERIAQLVPWPMFAGGIEEVPELAGSARGAAGFGSTGA